MRPDCCQESTLGDNMQTINEIAISSPEMSSWDFAARVPVIAQRKVGSNGLTISSYEMNRNKLVTALCAEFRDHFTAVLVKRDDKGNVIPSSMRVPSEYYDKAVTAVDAFIKSKMDEFLSHTDQLQPAKQRYVHQASKHNVFVRHTLVRNEVVSLQRQKMGIIHFIEETRRIIAKYDNQKAEWSSEVAERVNKLQKRLAREEETLAEIEKNMAMQPK